MLNQLFFAIKSAFRNFRKNWQYGGLNILGLSIAFATLILVITYLYQESTYESFHQLRDRIYRPTYHYTRAQSDYEVHWARIPVDYINELPNEIPEIEELVRFQNQEQKYIRIGEKRFKPKHAYVTDPEVFKIFDFELISGNSASALSEPNSIVLTESIAKKYFTTTDVIGAELVVTGDWSAEEEKYHVTGVMKDLPDNTHMPTEILFSFANEEERTGWAYVYTLLAEGATIDQVEDKMSAFVRSHAEGESASEISFEFQPLPAIHLHSQLAREIQPNGQIIYIRIFLWVALFVWIIALINFTNLSTALAMGRGKEVGVRKVLGASRSHLFLFSLTESVAYSFTALSIGTILSFFLFPVFGNLMGITIVPPLNYFIPLMLVVALFSGLIAGILPSLVMTSINILQIIREGKGWSMKSSSTRINVRRIMIAAQFCATIILIGSSVMAHLQFKYINEKNLGLESSQIIAITEVPQNVKDQYGVFKSKLSNIPGIQDVSACMQVPSSEIRDVGPVMIKGAKQDANEAPLMDMQIIDPNFVNMMELILVAGNDFSANVRMNPVPELGEELSAEAYLEGEPRKYLINETAMHQLGWNDPAEAIGREINWSIGSFDLAFGPVTGVIKDYHQESLKNQVDPLVLTVEPLWLGNFLIKVETDDLENILARIESTWNNLFPYAFEYFFLDELFNGLYRQDRVQLKLLSVLALIAIVISFLGLISLVAYALKTRSKELAIRRVIGADIKSLTTLIGKEYLWVLGIAAIVGIPLSYKWVSNWLENFAYHVPVSPFIYLIVVALVYALLLTTIYLQTLKATLDNPVKALREE